MHQRGHRAKEDLTENKSCVMELSLTVLNLNQPTHVGPEQTGAARGGEADHLRGLGQLDQTTGHVGHVSRAPVALHHVSWAPVSPDHVSGAPITLYHHDGGRGGGLGAGLDWDHLVSLTGSWLKQLDRLTLSCYQLG